MTTVERGGYPDQMMLPGQAAAYGGPVDMTMMYLMHHAFRRDLRRFAAAVPVTPCDDRATWAALAERWDRFSVLLHHHHQGEDAGIWPWLLERATPAERAVLEAMEAEHDKIDPLLAGCSEHFAALGADGDVGGDVGGDAAGREQHRAGLSVRLAATRDLLAHHLRHEETGAIPIIQAHMTPADWARIEKEHFRGGDARVKLSFVVPWLAEGISPAQLADVLAAVPPPIRVVWWLTRGGFRRGERRAFRYLAEEV
jgi:iron-sulfur cluster repair protein YtfE (RIC family)